MSYGVGQVGTVSVVVARVNQWIEKPEENYQCIFCFQIFLHSSCNYYLVQRVAQRVKKPESEIVFSYNL